MSENALNTLTVQQLKRAVAIKEKIARLEKELARLLGASQPNTAKTPRRRKMSAAGRARIAAAAKARWAKVKAAKKS